MIAGTYANIVVAVLCCTPFLATSASADCAWVLWATINGGLYNNVVAPVSTSDTKEACERGLDDQIAKQVETAKKNGMKVTASETMVIVQTRNKRGSLAPLGTQYVCLPDTVDPRAPKR